MNSPTHRHAPITAKISCELCDKELHHISSSHLKTQHNMNVADYLNMFPSAKLAHYAEKQISCSCGCGKTLTTPDRWGNNVVSLKGHVANLSNYKKHTIVSGTEGKECSSCSVWKPLSEFGKCQTSHDGLENRCKICAGNRALAYYNAHSTTINTYRRSEEYKQYFRPYQAAWDKKERKSNRNYVIRKTMRGMIRQLLRVQPSTHQRKPNTDKSRVLGVLGCSVAELKTHLERQFQYGMTWDNHGQGSGKWEIDHILPCSSFDLTDPKQLAACFHYTNIQPLWSIDNSRKRNKILSKEEMRELVCQKR